MREFNMSALEPFGQALLAYWQGDKSAVLLHEFRTGQKKSLPVSVFFRSHGELFPTEDTFAYCRGRILVVGAGTGVHALELEKQGYEVTAIDICPQAVHIMEERGIRDARHQDFLQFNSGERFDTILMLGHNIGICETLNGIKGVLRKCEGFLRPGGRLLVNSVKEPGSPQDKNAYPGELEFRLSYDGNTGPWMRWLHVDFETFASHAAKYGWSVKKLASSEEGGFLARLTPGL
ncbi:MAG: methyltransferase domain-containing protein [Proteobacteria bacterium]|nr:methyltransferase domain-containing protein [Pseudomonadota bacterium]